MREEPTLLPLLPAMKTQPEADGASEKVQSLDDWLPQIFAAPTTTLFVNAQAQPSVMRARSGEPALKRMQGPG